jgi:hypothetical protein
MELLLKSEFFAKPGDMPKEEGITVKKIIVYIILSILKLSAFLSG